jgi:Leucine-rich repeat (LRR) protein
LLESLGFLEELNLSDNNIENIDSIGYLTNLKRLYISNNNIIDFSPLLELESLEYIEISGNKVSKDQIEELISLGINVIFSEQ